MKTFILILLFKLIYLTNESPDNFRPNTFLNAYLEPLQTERNRGEFSGIRIKLFFDKSIPNDSIYRNWTKQAVNFFSSSLKVRPVNSRIFIERNCDLIRYETREEKTGKYEFYCIVRCSPVTYCGEIPVPEDHLNQCKYCIPILFWKSCVKEENKGSGVENADLILYVGSLRKDLCMDSNVMAHAGWCAKEGTLDRPIAGGINICPSTMQVDLETKRSFFRIMIHEVTHVLAFSQSLYGYFRDQNGNPLTERNMVGYPIGNRNKLKYVVSENVVRFVQRDWHVRGNRLLKKEAALIVTPKVVQEVRAHFNCPTLEGAELEDREQSYEHWEARIFQGEVMEAAGDINMIPVFSRISFALLEDTGWYQVNYSYAEPLEFGKNLGCDFCTKSCKYWMNRRGDPSPYCNKHKGIYCTFNRKAVGTCDLKRYVEEPKYQYFDDIEDVSKDQTVFYGGDLVADFCPIIHGFAWKEIVKGSACIQESNTPSIEDNGLLQSYEKNALCFESKTEWEVLVYPGTCMKGYADSRPTFQKVGCYKYSCEDGWLHIYVQNRKYTCFQMGQVIEVQILESTTMQLHKGTIICPCCEDICKNKAMCNPDNSHKAQQYKYKKDQCIENIVNKPTTFSTFERTSATEWKPFWETNALFPPSQEWSTQSTRGTLQTQTTTGETTTSTTASIIAESSPEASKTIAEKTEITGETSERKESSESVKVQTQWTKANDSTTTNSASDSKPVAPWTLLAIIGFIALSLIFSAIAYFLFRSEKTKKSKAKKQHHQSPSERGKMTKGKDLRKGQTGKETRDGHRRGKHH